MSPPITVSSLEIFNIFSNINSETSLIEHRKKNLVQRIKELKTQFKKRQSHYDVILLAHEYSLGISQAIKEYLESSTIYHQITPVVMGSFAKGTAVISSDLELLFLIDSGDETTIRKELDYLKNTIEKAGIEIQNNVFPIILLSNINNLRYFKRGILFADEYSLLLFSRPLYLSPTDKKRIEVFRKKFSSKVKLPYIFDMTQGYLKSTQVADLKSWEGGWSNLSNFMYASYFPLGKIGFSDILTALQTLRGYATSNSLFPYQQPLQKEIQPLDELLEQYMMIKDTRGESIITENDSKNLIEFQRLILQATTTSSPPVNFERKFKKTTKAIKRIVKKIRKISLDSVYYKAQTNSAWLKYFSFPLSVKQIRVCPEGLISQAI